MPKVNLCTISYNTKGYLQKQVDSLNSNYDTYQDFDHVIIDNGSWDGSVELLDSISKYPFVKDTVINTNIGYARACNRAAASGDAEIIGLLNADVWLTAEDVKLIAESFDANPDMAILGPKQRDTKDIIRHAGITGTNEKPEHRGWNIEDPDDSLYRDFKEMVTVSGSAYFIRREVWEDLTNCPTYNEFVKWDDVQGAFLPTGHYFEETFCSYHAREHGYKVMYDGRISIGHQWHASHEIGSKMDKLFQPSRELFRAACDAHGIPHD